MDSGKVRGSIIMMDYYYFETGAPLRGFSVRVNFHVKVKVKDLVRC